MKKRKIKAYYSIDPDLNLLFEEYVEDNLLDKSKLIEFLIETYLRTQSKKDKAKEKQEQKAEEKIDGELNP
jgi:hypothetical protein